MIMQDKFNQIAQKARVSTTYHREKFLLAGGYEGLSIEAIGYIQRLENELKMAMVEIELLKAARRG